MEGNPLKGIDPLGLTGRGGSNANTVGKKPPCGCDDSDNSDAGASTQVGGQAAIHVFVAGFSYSAGGAMGGGPSNAGMCTFQQFCMRLGPGAYVGVGGTISASGYRGRISKSDGPSIGIGGDIGTGASVGGQVTMGIDIDHGGVNSVAVATGHGGFGGGASAGIDFCWTELVCKESCNR